MQVHLIRENEDGSADFSFDLTSEERQSLLLYGIMQALKAAVEEGIKYDPGELSVGDTTSGGEDSVHGEGKQSSEPEQPSDGFKTSQVLG